MSQTPPPQYGQFMPNGRPRPGAPGSAPSSPPPPRYVDYGNPRAYDTSVRPTSGLTAARFAPAQIQRPDRAQPQSAWATQTRRVQEVSQVAASRPTVNIGVWLAVVALGISLILVLGFFFLMFVIEASASPAWWPIAAFCAVPSLIVIAGIMVLADLWDPQPLPLLLIAVFWGAAIAVIASYFINSFNAQLAFVVTGSADLAQLVSVVISAPVVEESAKGLGLLLLLVLARRYFNGPLDGLIYGSLLGGGFAFTENIIYYSRQLEAEGALQMLDLVIQRGLFGLFGHALYTSATGIIVGFVVRKWGTAMGFVVFLPALIPGMLMHFGWNFSAVLGLPLILMYGGQAILVVVWLILLGVLIWDESRLTRIRLGDYANHGWLTHEEVDMLATWKGRREGRRWARQIGARAVMKRFIRESADLASIRQRLLADGANPRVVSVERHLLQRLSANRQELLLHAR